VRVDVEPIWSDRAPAAVVFVDHYNHQRYHESINNLTPADAYFGRGQTILKQRERIKVKTMEYRRLQYRKYAA
jgi:putative transposase